MKKYILVCMMVYLIFFCLSLFSEQTPKISVDIENKIYPQKPFQILIKLKNMKQAYPYCFFPPQYETTNENIKLEVKSVKTTETKDEINLELCLEGLAKEVGVYDINSVKIPYVILSEDLESEFVKDNTRVLPTSYWETSPIRIEVKKNNWLKYRIGIVISIIIVIIVLIWALYLYKSKIKNKDIPRLEITDAQALHEARKFRLDGNYYEYLKVLFQIVQRLYEKEKVTDLEMLLNKIRERLDDVGYRGLKPTEAELEWFWKEIEKYINMQKEKED